LQRPSNAINYLSNRTSC